MAYSWGYRYRPLPLTVKLRSGARFHYETCDLIPISIYYLGTWEAHCLPYLRAFAPPGSTVLDVGANIGFYSVEIAASVGSSGRVIAIEPIPWLAASVRRNLDLNGFAHAEVMQVAAGNGSGTVELALPVGVDSNPGMFAVWAAESGNGIRADLRRIDDIVEELDLSSLDLIKMDIEGSEQEAIAGARKTLDRFRPAILIELNDQSLRQCGSSAAELRGALDRAGYKGWLLGRDGARPLGVEFASFAECLFVHKDRPDHVARARSL